MNNYICRHHVSHHSYTHLGESPKSGLEIRLHLNRRLSLHVTQTFIPSTMFVFISWLSLFIPAELVPGRMALCVTTLLTLVTMFSSTRSATPSTAYLKSSDIWMFGCLSTVFIILSEYCFVLYVRKMSHYDLNWNWNSFWSTSIILNVLNGTTVLLWSWGY